VPPGTVRFAVYPSAEQAIRAAADLFTALAPQTIALAGGSTPRDLYQLLASEDYRDRVEWSEMDIWWGDERAVPPDHPDSNYGMAKKAILDLVPIVRSEVHRMPADSADLDAAALAYEETLPDRFDVILLGIGDDGHTASLFPDRPALDESERRCVPTVAANGSRRLTLTYPVLNAARHVLFLVLGEAKRDALDRIRAGAQLPAARVRPTFGDVTWVVDEAAYGPRS
jgi:6-phosphogluconolactonase